MDWCLALWHFTASRVFFSLSHAGLVPGSLEGYCGWSEGASGAPLTTVPANPLALSINEASSMGRYFLPGSFLTSSDGGRWQWQGRGERGAMGHPQRSAP